MKYVKSFLIFMIIHPLLSWIFDMKQGVCFSAAATVTIWVLNN